MARAAAFVAVVCAGLMCNALAPTAPAAEGDQVRWGEPVDGLQISITPTKAVYEEADGSPEFRVALRNSGEADLMLNLGFMLGNGKNQYPTAVRLSITDCSGNRRELDLVVPGIRGRVDDFVVPLPAGATYALSAVLKDYWCLAAEERVINLAEGLYQIAAAYEGKGPQWGGIGLMPFWRGRVASPTATFVVVGNREASP